MFVYVMSPWQQSKLQRGENMSIMQFLPHAREITDNINDFLLSSLASTTK